MHRKPLLQQRPLPVPQMLQPFPSRTPRALPLPTPRPKLEDLLSHLEWATFPHRQPPRNHKRAPKSPIVPRPPTPARTPRHPHELGNHRRESPAVRPRTARQERAFTVTVGADFHRRCAGTPPRHGKGSVTIFRQRPRRASSPDPRPRPRPPPTKPRAPPPTPTRVTTTRASDEPAEQRSHLADRRALVRQPRLDHRARHAVHHAARLRPP